LWAQEPIVRTNVPLVIIPVSVTDTRGHFVSDLGSSDFVILDNGVPQDVRMDDPDLITAPLDLVVLVQTSDISDAALKKIKKSWNDDSRCGRRGKTGRLASAIQTEGHSARRPL
jgi:hypothetical protein